MKQRRSSSFLGRGTLLVALLAAATGAKADLFPPLSHRYRVGDPDSINPLSFRQGPKHLATGDLNEDGLDDTVTANLDGSISILLSTPEGRPRDQILVPARGLLEGSSLRAVAVADLNNDGSLDVAAADIAREGVVILLGDGSGTLTPIDRVDLGPARALATADVDKNGTTDLLVASSPADCENFDSCYEPIEEDEQAWCEALELAPPSLALLRGNGDGTFGAPVLLLEDHPGCLYDVATVDLDDDGNVDVVALDYTNRELLRFVGYGDGTFDVPASLIIPGKGPRAFSIAYLDETLVDGAPPAGANADLVVANRDSATLTIFLGGDGFSFLTPRTVETRDLPRDVTAADLDGDGNAELIATYRNANVLAVHRGLGGATFDEIPLEFPTGRSPRHVVLGDLNGDGVLDAAVNNRVSEDVSVFLGKSGVPGFLVSKGFYSSGIQPVDVVVGDFDMNGEPDVASVSLRSHDLHVRRNTGDGVLGDEDVYALHYEPSSVVTGDLDGDTHLDLVVSSLGSSVGSGDRGALLVLIGRGDGTFEAPTVVRDDVIYRPVSLRLGDLSGDGVLDVAAGGLNGELVLYRGRGDGTFDEGVQLPHREVGLPLNLTLGDFDNDGRLDIATSQASLIMNDGRFFSGATGASHDFAASVPNVDKTWFVDSGDLDSDGHLDLMLALTFVRPDPIAVFFGKGDGTFHFPDIYAGPDMGVVASLAEDMDGDGLVDIVIGNRCAASVIILKGIGQRKFERVETVPVHAAEGLAVADMNLDGRPDLVGVGFGLWTLINGEEAPLVEPPAVVPSTRLPEGIYINEVMSFNRGSYSPVAGETPDWLELFLHGSEARDLAGHVLRQHSRDGDILDWSFPDDARIDASGYLTIFCGSEVDFADGLVCPFGLFRGGGESIALIDPEGKELDRIVLPPMPADVSYARDADATRYFSYNPVPTPGRSNSRPNNLKPLLTSENPFIIDGGERIGVTASIFDDIGTAYASVNFRLAGESRFTELALGDDGRHGDGVSGDAVFGALLPRFPPGSTVEYYLRTVDLEGGGETEPSDGNGELLRVAVPQSPSSLHISELVADNDSGLQDEDGEFEDWVELENCGLAEVSLDGLALTKDYFDDDAAWPFPAGITLTPGARLVVFCDKDEVPGGLHASFRLGRDGDQILLVRRGDVSEPLDSIAFGPLGADVAFGRPRCGEEAQILSHPTPGGPNVETAEFRRGDANVDSATNIADPVYVLNHLFGGGPIPLCMQTADANDDNVVNVADPVYQLNHLFGGGPPLSSPVGECGADPTPAANAEDDLSCEAYPPCE